MASLYRRYQRGLIKPRRIGFVPFEHKPPAGAVAIGLTKGCTAWVDEADWPVVARYRWYATLTGDQRTCYAETATFPDEPRRQRRILGMHRALMGCPGVDHLVHRPLIADNRRSNMRIASRSDNARNKRKTKALTSSTFKGVCWEKFTRRWKADIEAQGKTRSIGRFKTEMEAAAAYDRAATEVFGEFACTNFKTPGAGNWLFDFLPFGIVRRDGAEA